MLMFDAELKVYDDTGNLKPAIRAIEEHRTKLHNAEAVSEAVKRWRKVPEDQGLQTALLKAVADRDAHAPPKPLPKAVAVPKVEGNFPAGILGAAGQKGAFLSEGSVCVLAGAGGVAKTALTLGVAADFALAEDGATLCDGLFRADTGGGPVLFLTYEDPAPVIAWKLRELKAYVEDGEETLNRIHVMDMMGHPLFGPGARAGGASGLYNARPEPLSGWAAMEAECDRTEPRLIVIDPATAAFTGEANAAGPVREFMTALAGFARDRKCGIMVIAHTNKASRGRDADPLDPGATGGSTHWTDAGRGCLVLDWKPEKWAGDAGDLVLAVAKSNWGPSRIWCDVEPVRYNNGGAVIGVNLKPGAGWEKGSPKAKSGSKGKKANVDKTRDRGRRHRAQPV
ncbi:MAG: AAA family ATPase [Rhodobacter sp.]|nr:AAA family ATPase [Rhodobacter sp.]